MNGSNHVPTTKSTLFVVDKDEWRALVSPQRMHCMYSSIAKWVEATSNSKKIKPVALAIVELHGIGQAVRKFH